MTILREVGASEHQDNGFGYAGRLGCTLDLDDEPHGDLGSGADWLNGQYGDLGPDAGSHQDRTGEANLVPMISLLKRLKTNKVMLWEQGFTLKENAISAGLNSNRRLNEDWN